MRRGLKYLLITLGLILVASSTVTKAEYYRLTMQLDITDAYYTDADFDENDIENDIITEFVLKINYRNYEDEDEDEDNYKVSFKVKLKVKLILPSEFEYEYEMYMYVEKEVTFATLYFFNHATESGWYYVSILAEISKGELNAFDEMIFDPPGSNGDNDPPEIMLVY